MGGRELESKPPRTGWRPLPDLKSVRPTGVRVSSGNLCLTPAAIAAGVLLDAFHHQGRVAHAVGVADAARETGLVEILEDPDRELATRSDVVAELRRRHLALFPREFRDHAREFGDRLAHEETVAHNL